MMHKILFVDDEENILNTIRRQLRNESYQLLFANGGSEALEVLKKNDISVIISDMRMPGISGAEFLEMAKDIQPDSIKMVLSGHAEIDTVLDSINMGNVWKFIIKPWGKEELKIAISNAVELYEGKRREKKLLESLQLKTKELEEVNLNLDKKVKERTWILNERSEILNLLLEELDTDKVIKRLCQTLSAIAQGDIVITIDGCIFSNNSSIVQYEKTNSDFITNITKNDFLLGRLIIINNPSFSKQQLDEIYPVLNIVLQYKNTLNNSKDLLDDIDKAMGEL